VHTGRSPPPAGRRSGPESGGAPYPDADRFRPHPASVLTNRADIDVAQAHGQSGQHPTRNGRGRLAEQRGELASIERENGHWPAGGHRRDAGRSVEQGQLTEEAPGPHGGELLAVDGRRRVPLDDDEELPAPFPFAHHHLTRLDVDDGGDRRDPPQLGVGACGEQGHVAKQLDARIARQSEPHDDRPPTWPCVHSMRERRRFRCARIRRRVGYVYSDRPGGVRSRVRSRRGPAASPRRPG